MSRSLRIAVADDEPDMRDFFGQVLPIMGHQVVSVSQNGRELIEHCRALHPELLITDVKMPQLDGIEAAEQICKDQPIPVILVSAYHDHELLGRAEQGHVMAYLVKPIEEADIEVAIGIAMRRFEQFQAVSKEASDLRQALEDRKLIERAKGIVMKHSGLDEQGAFRRLHKMSWDQNRKLVEIARMILLAEEVFQPSDKSRVS